MGEVHPAPFGRERDWQHGAKMEPQRLQPALRALLRAMLHRLEPSPGARALPGSPMRLRAFTAEAAPAAAAAEERAAAAAASAASKAAAAVAEDAPAASAAAVAAYEAAAAAAEGAGTRLGLRVVSDRHSAQDPRHTARLASFLGLTDVLEQQQAALTGGVAGTGGPGQSPALQAMTWHQRYMDDTPAGRELRRNWQRQVILETKVGCFAGGRVLCCT